MPRIPHGDPRLIRSTRKRLTGYAGSSGSQDFSVGTVLEVLILRPPPVKRTESLGAPDYGTFRHYYRAFLTPRASKRSVW